MKGRFILAAMHDWDGSEAIQPLPTVVSKEKLAEIHMIPPPFPPLHQLTYNFLLLPERPDAIQRRVQIWQDNSRQLTAWICQAQVNSARLPNSWK